MKMITTATPYRYDRVALHRPNHANASSTKKGQAVRSGSVAVEAKVDAEIGTRTSV